MNKKIFNRLFYLIIILIVIFVGLLIFFRNFIKDFADKYVNVVQAVTCFSTILILLAAIYDIRYFVIFYLQDKQDSIKKSQREYKQLWYTKYLLDRNFDAIDEYLNASIDIMENCKAIVSSHSVKKEEDFEQKIRALFSKYTFAKIRFSEKFVYILNAIDTDFSIGLINLLNQFQEQYTGLLSSYSISKDEKYYKKLSKLNYHQKEDLYKFLYHFFN